MLHILILHLIDQKSSLLCEHVIIIYDTFLSLWLPFRLSTVRVEFTINVSHNDLIPVSPILFPVDVNWQKTDEWMHFICLSAFFCNWLAKLRTVSVRFITNALLNEVAPLSPISLTVGFDVNAWKGFFFLLSCSPLKSRFWSVVFDINGSLKDAISASPILLSVLW